MVDVAGTDKNFLTVSSSRRRRVLVFSFFFSRFETF